MNCPDREIIQDYIDSELSDTNAKSITEHIRTCSTCKKQLQELLAFHDTLNSLVENDQCPSIADLERYSNNTCQQAQANEIGEHIGLCSRCQTYVWALGASQQELDNWQKQEEQGFREYLARTPGYIAAKESLLKLLPAKLEMLDESWQSVLSWVSSLKDKALENWPSLTQQPQLAGVLGFAQTSDPQSQATSIILMTTLYVSEAIADGTIKSSQQDIEIMVKQVAEKLGAGKELQKRLLETVPAVILQVYKDGDV